MPFICFLESEMSGVPYMEPLNAVSLADALDEAAELRRQHASATSIHIYDDDTLVVTLKKVSVRPQPQASVMSFPRTRAGAEAERPPNLVDERVGRGLRRLRLNSGLSISQVATALDIEQSRLIAIESGFARVSAQRLMAFCAFFGVPASGLYSDFHH